MKLVDQYLDPQDAAAARRRLREAGVASLVDSMDPHSVQPSKSGVTHIGLWVVVDDQFEDAVRILENPAHQPLRVLSPQEMDIIEKSAEQRSGSSSRFSDRAQGLLFLAIMLALIAYTAIDFFIGL